MAAPENLLLSDDDEEPTLKIADFGLSSAMFGRGAASIQPTTQLRRLKSVVGSPHYVAPEVLNDNSDGYEGTILCISLSLSLSYLACSHTHTHTRTLFFFQRIV